MSDTLNIVYSRSAPGSFSLTYSVGGTPPNMSTGYTASLEVYRSGLSTLASPDVAADTTSGITLGAAGAIQLNLVTINSALNTVDATEAIWMYRLTVTPTGNPEQYVCGGYLVRAQP